MSQSLKAWAEAVETERLAGEAKMRYDSSWSAINAALRKHFPRVKIERSPLGVTYALGIHEDGRYLELSFADHVMDRPDFVKEHLKSLLQVPVTTSTGSCA